MSKKTHPELRSGEIYLGNQTQEEYHHRICWKTKRIGILAYDNQWRPIKSISGLYPVFVQKTELDKAGIKL